MVTYRVDKTDGLIGSDKVMGHQRGCLMFKQCDPGVPEQMNWKGKKQ